ncbi:MAG: methyltransferase domain-containing protein [Patescibacteria group bacterium]
MKNMPNYYNKVTEYFNEKASSYDEVDNQKYWVLSDMFFKEILRRELPALIGDKKHINLLDAGAGTGRWTIFFDEIFKDQYDITGTLVDISSKMLDEASKKLKASGADTRFKIKNTNIENLEDFPNKNFDLSLSFYNVISFVEDPKRALTEIHRVLSDDGVHISIVANKYHAYYFSFLTNRLSSIDSIKKDSKVRFNDLMPAIHCFTPEELKDLYLSAGFKTCRVIGGPNFIYPGMEETYVHGSTPSLQEKLAEADNFQKILEAELEYYNMPDIVGRGNVLLAIATK